LVTEAHDAFHYNLAGDAFGKVVSRLD